MNDAEHNPSTDDLRSRGRASLGDYCRLVRLPNVLTAVADVAMGFLFAQLPTWRWSGWHDGPVLGLLAIASMTLYAAGTTLNDYFDRELDRRERPERPIPSGRVSPRAARRLGGLLLAFGLTVGLVAAAIAARPATAIVVAALAATIVLYDARLKPTLFGPVAMGGCRMLNVLMGMSAAAAPIEPDAWLVAGAVGVYVAGIAWFARGESASSRRTPLLLATGIMLLGIAMLVALPRVSDRLVMLLRAEPERWYLLVGILGAMVAWRCLRAVVRPTALNVQRATAHALVSLVVLDAAACFAVRDLYWACLILAILPPTVLLGRPVAMT